jgi:hypothetical protein
LRKINRATRFPRFSRVVGIGVERVANRKRASRLRASVGDDPFPRKFRRQSIIVLSVANIMDAHR